MTLVTVIFICATRDCSLVLCKYQPEHTDRSSVSPGAQTVARVEPHVMSRDVAGDKWVSCRAIDCARRTDRLVLMCFVASLAPRAPKPFGYRGEILRQEYIHGRSRRRGWCPGDSRGRGNYAAGDFAADVVPTAPGILSSRARRRKRSALSRLSPWRWWCTRVVPRNGQPGEKSPEPRG